VKLLRLHRGDVRIGITIGDQKGWQGFGGREVMNQSDFRARALSRHWFS
jgi:hypothetical protein